MDCGFHAREWISPAFCQWFVKEVGKLSNKEFSQNKSILEETSTGCNKCETNTIIWSPAVQSLAISNPLLSNFILWFWIWVGIIYLGVHSSLDVKYIHTVGQILRTGHLIPGVAFGSNEHQDGSGMYMTPEETIPTSRNWCNLVCLLSLATPFMLETRLGGRGTV